MNKDKSLKSFEMGVNKVIKKPFRRSRMIMSRELYKRLLNSGLYESLFGKKSRKVK